MVDIKPEVLKGGIAVKRQGSLYCPDPYRALASAIIQQAVEDYREARYLMNCPGRTDREKKRDEKLLRSCEQFFRSVYFEIINTVDITGEEILEVLENERSSSNAGAR